MNADRVKVAVTAGGTGALTLGAAATNYRTPAALGLGGANKDGLVSYLVEWATGWAIGLGLLSADGLTLTRDVETESSETNGVLYDPPFATVPAGGATVALALHSRSALLCTTAIPQSPGPLVKSFDCLAAGAGRIGANSDSSIALGAYAEVGDNAPGGMAIGPGIAQVTAPGGMVIGAGVADQPAMECYGMPANAQPEIAFSMGLITSPSTGTHDITLDGTLMPQVPAQYVWLFRVFLVGVVSTGNAVGNAKSREFRLMGKASGQIGTTQTIEITGDAGWSGTITSQATIDGSGHLRLQVNSGAFMVAWQARVEVTPVLASEP